MATILVMVPDAGGSGSVASVVRNHLRLLGRRHQVVLLSATLPAFEIPNVEYMPVRVRAFDWARRFGHIARELHLTRAFLREASQICRSRAVHVSISHSHALAALVGVRLRRDFGVKAMLFAHADIFDRPPGTYDPLVTRWYRHVTPIAYREADRTLAVSGYIRNAAVRNGAAAHQARVVPNGIDIDELAPASASMACDTRATANRFVIVYVGRLAPEKGVADLIAAAALLKERQVDFTLRLVGDGPLRSELERMVDSLRLGYAVEFVGSLDRSALADCYSSAHVTCVPSISEPQGLVVLESLICGTPVVGSAVGGIPDMIVDGVNGRLVAPSSPVQLADALQNLALDRVGWRKLQSASAQSVRDRWSWDVIGDRLEAEITELLSAA